MAFPADVLPTVTEIRVDDAWVAITSDVRGEDAITMTHGQANEQGQVSACRADLSINNRDGRYSPRNPLSPYYGKIGRNTELRVRIEDFAETPSLRSAVTTAEVDSVPAYYCNVPTGVVPGDVLIAFQSADSTALDDMFPPSQDELATDTAALWTERLAFVTDATNDLATKVWTRVVQEGEPTRFIFWQDAAADGVTIMAAIKDAKVSQISYASLVEPAPGPSFVTPSSTPGGSNDFDLRYVAGTDAVGAAATFTSPATYAELADLQSRTFTCASLASKALTSNAATGTQTFTCSNGGLDTGHGVTVTIMADSVQFHGEVPAWPSRWDVTGTDIWVPLQASGILRRLGQGAAPIHSALYRGITTDLAGHLKAYWPLEEGSNATIFANVVNPQYPMNIPPTGVVPGGGIQPGAATEAVATVELGAVIRGPVGVYTGTKWTVGALMYFGSEPNGDQSPVLSWQTSGRLAKWFLRGDSSNDEFVLLALDSDNNTIVNQIGLNIGRPLVNEWLFVQVSMFPEVGQDQWSFSMIAQPGDTLSASGFVTTDTIGQVTNVSMSNGGGVEAASVGHVFVADSGLFDDTFFNVLSYLPGFAGEQAAVRIQRLCAEEGIDVEVIGGPEDSERMGIQRVGALLELLNDCAAADQGILFEPYEFFGMSYRTRVSLYNQASSLDMDYALKHLSQPFEPTDDDQLVRNDVTVRRLDGSFGRATKETGPLSVLPPPLGVGRYDDTLTVNLYEDAQAEHLAAWRVHVGTWDEARFPAVAVKLERDVWVASASRTREAAQARPGDVFTITSPPAWMPPDPIRQIVRGRQMRLSNKQWWITWNGSPAGPYEVLVLDDDERGRLDTDGSELDIAISSSATAFDVATTDPAWPLWATDNAECPFDVGISGERVTVTDVAASLITFGAAGTVTHANNASVTPGIPASVATGNLLLIFAAIRNSGTGVPNTPTGYTRLPVFDASDNCQLFGKIALSGAEVAPLVSFTGGVANADTSAQMIRLAGKFHDVNNVVVKSNALLNTAAQDIRYPALQAVADNCFVLYLGWKQDDWTSVAAIAGATEIGEPDTVTGDDQGIVWDYVIQTTQAAIVGGSFVVTGGAAAASRGAVLAIRADKQAFTVTRSINGMVKAHSAGAAVSLWQPAVLGL